MKERGRRYDRGEEEGGAYPYAWDCWSWWVFVEGEAVRDLAGEGQFGAEAVHMNHPIRVVRQ